VEGRRRRSVALVLWSVFGFASFAFSRTRGLAYLDSDSATGLSFVADLKSTGGDDNLCIALGVGVATLALGFHALRLRLPVRRLDLAVHTLLLAVQSLYFVAALEVGSVRATVIEGGNLSLLLWLLVLVALWAWLAIARDGGSPGSTEPVHFPHPGPLPEGEGTTAARGSARGWCAPPSPPRPPPPP
jgi:hypothetical protein